MIEDNCHRQGKYVGMIGGALVLCSLPVHAEPPYQIAWTRQIGSLAHNDWSVSVAVDALGNAYMSGFTEGKIGQDNLGGVDAFLTKHDPLGNLLWARQIGTQLDDHSRSVAVDADGNAYISGRTLGSLGGPNLGAGDAFLAKYSAMGDLLWTRQIGTEADEASHAVAVDARGNAFITGYTTGDIAATNAGGRDVYVTKFDASGNLAWTRQVGSGSTDESRAAAVDSSGNLYISGWSSRSLGGPSAGDNDAFIFKFDTQGNVLWSRQIGTISSDISFSVAADLEGNAYISGRTLGSLGGIDTGNGGAFLAKFDPRGNHLWSRQIGAEGSNSVAVDSTGNAYITGTTRGSLGGPNQGFTDMYVAKFDSFGILLWVQQIGTPDFESSNAITVDAFGNVVISGSRMVVPRGYGQNAILIKLVVPEPTTLALAGLTAVGFAGHRRRCDATGFHRVNAACTAGLTLTQGRSPRHGGRAEPTNPWLRC